MNDIKIILIDFLKSTIMVIIALLTTYFGYIYRVNYCSLAIAFLVPLILSLMFKGYPFTNKYFRLYAIVYVSTMVLRYMWGLNLFNEWLEPHIDYYMSLDGVEIIFYLPILVVSLTAKSVVMLIRRIPNKHFDSTNKLSANANNIICRIKKLFRLLIPIAALYFIFILPNINIKNEHTKYMETIIYEECGNDTVIHSIKYKSYPFIKSLGPAFIINRDLYVATITTVDNINEVILYDTKTNEILTTLFYDQIKSDILKILNISTTSFDSIELDIYNFNTKADLGLNIQIHSLQDLIDRDDCVDIRIYLSKDDINNFTENLYNKSAIETLIEYSNNITELGRYIHIDIYKNSYSLFASVGIGGGETLFVTLSTDDGYLTYTLTNFFSRLN